MFAPSSLPSFKKSEKLHKFLCDLYESEYKYNGVQAWEEMIQAKENNKPMFSRVEKYSVTPNTIKSYFASGGTAERKTKEVNPQIENYVFLATGVLLCANVHL